jgi:hypothetical protein
MFAVFSDDSVVYLGDNQETIRQLDEDQEVAIYEVDNLQELKEIFDTYCLTEEKSPFAQVLEHLADVGFNMENVEQFTTQVRERGKNIASGIRDAGVRGLKVIGDGFVALGQQLQQADEEKSECCDHQCGCKK